MAILQMFPAPHHTLHASCLPRDDPSHAGSRLRGYRRRLSAGNAPDRNPSDNSALEPHWRRAQRARRTLSRLRTVRGEAGAAADAVAALHVQRDFRTRLRRDAWFVVWPCGCVRHGTLNRISTLAARARNSALEFRVGGDGNTARVRFWRRGMAG